MDREELVTLFDERLKSLLTQCKADISSMENVMTKISGISNSEQVSKISGLLNVGHTFKRKSNEEQYKCNSKVSIALEEADNLLQSEKIVESREKIAEGINVIYFTGLHRSLLQQVDFYIQYFCMSSVYFYFFFFKALTGKIKSKVLFYMGEAQ